MHFESQPSMESPRNGRAGFTLLEAVIATGSAAFLFVGLASTLFIANRVATAPLLPRMTLETSFASTRVMEDLKEAIHIIDHSIKHVEFVRSDCDGDGLPDVVRYEHTGQLELLRRVDGGANEQVAKNVNTFSLTLGKITESEEVPITKRTYGILFGTANDAPSSDELPSTAPTNHPLGQLVSQTFVATDHAGIVASADWYGIDTIFVYTNGDKANSEMWMTLGYGSGARQPTSESLTDQFPPSLVDSSKFNTDTHVRYGFKLAEPICHLDPRERLALTFPFEPPGPSTAGSSGLDIGYSNDGGASWTQEANKLDFLVGGFATNVVSTTRVGKSRYRFAHVTMQVGDEAATTMTSQTEITNRPLVATNRWEARFDIDPLTVDLDASGVADWSSQTFDSTELSNGLWNMPTNSVQLQTAGTNGFAAEHTEVNLVCRVLKEVKTGALKFRIPWNRTDVKCHGLVVHVSKDESGMQQVQLLNGDKGSLLTTVRNLPDQLLHVRLLFIKPLGQVVLWIDDHYFGSIPLESIPWSAQFASLETIETPAEVDLLEIIEY